MDSTVTVSSSTKEQAAVPAQLWIGASDATNAKINALLKGFFCSKNECHTCRNCRMITERQHHAMMWLTPEKQYTRDELAPLFKQLSFQLDEHESFFFVIEKADFLTPVCANSLLKSLEEPPPGYRFLLVAERLNLILPTIQSRCTIHQIRSAQSASTHPLFDFFTSTRFHDPLAFAKTLDQSGINERESIELLDELISFWATQHRQALAKGNENQAKTGSNVMKLFTSAHATPPMPGSSKLFWRNLFLLLKTGS